MIEVLFVIPNSSKTLYQDLANIYSAIEPPTWALLLASSVRKSSAVSGLAAPRSPGDSGGANPKDF